jgi:hypothetical protein
MFRINHNLSENRGYENKLLLGHMSSFSPQALPLLHSFPVVAARVHARANGYTRTSP